MSYNIQSSQATTGWYPGLNTGVSKKFNTGQYTGVFTADNGTKAYLGSDNKTYDISGNQVGYLEGNNIYNMNGVQVGSLGNLQNTGIHSTADYTTTNAGGGGSFMVPGQCGLTNPTPEQFAAYQQGLAQGQAAQAATPQATTQTNQATTGQTATAQTGTQPNYIGQFLGSNGTVAYMGDDGYWYTADGTKMGYKDGDVIYDMNGNVVANMIAGTDQYINANTGVVGTYTPYETATTGTTASTTTGTTTGTESSTGGVDYPMDALALVSQFPHILAQTGLLGGMMSNPFMQEYLKPYISSALESIGNTGLSSSSYADQLVTDAIQTGVYQNLSNVLSGLENLTPQLTSLSEAYQMPYVNMLNSIMALYA